MGHFQKPRRNEPCMDLPHSTFFHDENKSGNHAHHEQEHEKNHHHAHHHFHFKWPGHG